MIAWLYGAKAEGESPKRSSQHGPPGARPVSGDGREPTAGPATTPSSDSDEGVPAGGRPSSGGAAGILATLVPTGFRQPHMIERMADGGPAHTSGQVQPGDQLLEVDEADVRTLSLKEIQAKIIGRPATQVTLTLQRGKHNFPHKVTLTRSVETKTKDSPRAAEFAPSSPRGLSKDADLLAQNRWGQGRGNPRYIASALGGHQPMGVPPLFGAPGTGAGEDFYDQEGRGTRPKTTEQALEAKATFWREKFISLERQVNEGAQDQISRVISDDQATTITNKLYGRIGFLEAELEKARRFAVKEEQAARLEGQVKVLQVQLEKKEEARVREESRRIEVEDELRTLLLSKGSDNEQMTARTERLQAMLESERKTRAAEEKRVEHFTARLEAMRNLETEKSRLDAKVQELSEALRASRADATTQQRMRGIAEESLHQLQSGQSQVDAVMAQTIKDLRRELEDARNDLRESDSRAANSEAAARKERSEAFEQKRRVDIEKQELQDDLDRKVIELHDLQTAIGSRMPTPAGERSSEIIEAQKTIRRLQQDLDSAQTTIAENMRETSRLRDLLHKADASESLDALRREVKDEQKRFVRETQLKLEEREARNTAEQQLASLKAEENRRSARLESMLRKLEADLEASSERSKKLEHERHELVRALEIEREQASKKQDDLSSQNKNLSSSLAKMGHDLSAAEKKYVEVLQDFKELERSAADQRARLETRLTQLEQQTAKNDVEFINTRRHMEQDEMLVQKAQRELQDWMHKCHSAEKRCDQVSSSLNMKEDALCKALADSKEERGLRQKLEIELDSFKHQNVVLKEELETKGSRLEACLRESNTLLELERASRLKAESKTEELRASVQHLSIKSDGLEDKSHDVHDRLQKAEAQRDRLGMEVEQLEAKLNATSKEMHVRMREADDEAMKMRDQLQADSHLLAREQREKQALERQLEDANFECRKIAVLQHRVDDLQVLYQKELTAREEAEQGLHKAQKYAESVSEWDRALQEKNQRLQNRIETLEQELAASQVRQEKAEILAKDTQELASKDTRKINDLQSEVKRLTDEAERASMEMMEQRTRYTSMHERLDAEQGLARRKAQELEVAQKRIVELTDIAERDKHLFSQIGSEEERLQREVELLKRNLVRSDEISADERKMRQEVQRELDRLKADYAKVGDHRLIDHRVASHDVVAMRQRLQEVERERDEAVFKVTQHTVRHGEAPTGPTKDEEMLLLLAENAQRDEELIRRLSANTERDTATITRLQQQAEKDENRLLHFAQQLKLAQEELQVAHNRTAVLERQTVAGPAGSSNMKQLEKELYLSQEAVVELKRRYEELQEDNQRLERALQAAQDSAHEGTHGRSQSGKKVAELEQQLEHLIKLRTKGEELLSSRLAHAEEDRQRAIQRADKAEHEIVRLTARLSAQ